MSIRLGDVLVDAGVITDEQRNVIVQEQLTLGRPFGELAETLFDVDPLDIESAWATQYAMIAGVVDPRLERVDAEVAGLITSRQAWQFRILPLSFDGSDLRICTTQDDLPRALRFAAWRLGHQCHFVVAEPHILGEALCQHFPMDGMTPESVSGPAWAAPAEG